MEIAIVVTTFCRPEILDKCLASIINANTEQQFPIVIIWQVGDLETSDVLAKYEDNIDHLIKIRSLGKTPLENINMNRILGTHFAFNYLKCEFVIGIEEDSMISSDALDFCNNVWHRYRGNRKFRGINLGSFELPSIAAEKDYSLIRYGTNGQAGGISKRVWSNYNFHQMMKNASAIAFDSMLENYMKTGFVVTPNRSRYVNFGWDGTHAPKDKEDSFYKRIEASWLSSPSDLSSDYKLRNITHSWREDAIIYRKIMNFKYIVLCITLDSNLPNKIKIYIAKIVEAIL